MGEISANMTLPSRITHKYGSHDLQTLSIWPLSHSALYDPSPSKIWVIYIHGGAWRDPAVTNLCITPTITELLSNQSSAESIKANVAAFASLDYRLSAHTNIPQDPSTTPETAYRNAKHPDHINDVISGLKLLQDKYSFGNNYVLVGHSCGATLAFQTLMTDVLLSESKHTLPSPKVVAGVCGIYDVDLIVKNHADSPWASVYSDFAKGAFGLDKKTWDLVSPARFEGFGRWKIGAGRKLALVALSTGDELVEKAQADVMLENLKGLGKTFEVLQMGNLEGRHDEVWKLGEGMAKVIYRAVKWIEDEQARVEV